MNMSRLQVRQEWGNLYWQIHKNANLRNFKNRWGLLAQRNSGQHQTTDRSYAGYLNDCLVLQTQSC